MSKKKGKLHKLIKLMKFWPPLLGAGIKVEYVNDNMTKVVSSLTLRWYNRNLYKSHYGGSLFSMTDPFYVFIVGNYLGKNYFAVDKEASIKFIKPGTGKVTSSFEVDKKKLEQIKKEVDENSKGVFDFNCIIIDSNKEVVAEVSKKIYVKKK